MNGTIFKVAVRDEEYSGQHEEFVGVAQNTVSACQKVLKIVKGKDYAWRKPYISSLECLGDKAF